jgi:hypothetical protein
MNPREPQDAGAGETLASSSSIPSSSGPARSPRGQAESGEERKSPMAPSSSFNLLPNTHWLIDVPRLAQDTRNHVETLLSETSYASFVDWLSGLNNDRTHSTVVAAIIKTVNEREEKEQDLAWGLIELLYNAKIVSSRSIRRAFDRIYSEFENNSESSIQPKVVLDFLGSCINAGFLPARSLFRVPASFYEQGRASAIIRDVVEGDVSIANLFESLPQAKQSIINIITESYASGVPDDIYEFLNSAVNKHYASILIRKVVELALEKDAQVKDLASQILASLQSHTQPAAFVEAFDDLIWRIEDLLKDTPDADIQLSKFLARAIADESLPANYFHDAEPMNSSESSKEIKILRESLVLLKSPETISVMPAIWKPQVYELVDLKQQIKTIILEFFDSLDIEEALRCLKNLSCPHYMHEFVRRSGELVMEKTPREEQELAKLIKLGVQRGVLSSSQVETGLSRLNSQLSELKLDAPLAESVYIRFSSLLTS